MKFTRDTKISDFRDEIERTVYLTVRKFGWATVQMIAIVLQREHPRENGYKAETVRRILSRLEKKGFIICEKLKWSQRKLKRKRLSDELEKAMAEREANGLYVDREALLERLQDKMEELYPYPSEKELQGDPTIYYLAPKARSIDGIRNEAGIGYPYHRALCNMFLLSVIQLKIGKEIDFFLDVVTENEVNISGNDFFIGEKKPDAFISFDKGEAWCAVEVENTKKNRKYCRDIAKERVLIGILDYAPTGVFGRNVGGLNVVQLIIVHGYPESTHYLLPVIETCGLTAYERGEDVISESLYENETDYIKALIRSETTPIQNYFMTINHRLAVTKNLKKFYAWWPKPKDWQLRKYKKSYLTESRLEEIETEMGWRSPKKQNTASAIVSAILGIDEE